MRTLKAQLKKKHLNRPKKILKIAKKWENHPKIANKIVKKNSDIVK